MLNNKKVRCLLLLSGGLDSILSAKILMQQGIEVVPINFATSFCGPKKARKASMDLGLALREVNIKNEFVEILKKPKHGYGSGMNPCIDCHGLMLKKAQEIMQEEGFDFVASGEVLNERPMSQTKRSLKIVEEEAGLVGYLLRPLSAKCLPPTIVELDGRVDREKLEGISGRSRKRQIELAKNWGIKEYPTPAGGCALTEADFANRVRNLLDNKSTCTLEDVELLKVGRQFWIDKSRVVVGRNELDNARIEKMAEPTDYLLKAKDITGPVALIRGNCTPDIILKTAKIMVDYMKKKLIDEDKLIITIDHDGMQTKESIQIK